MKKISLLLFSVAILVSFSSAQTVTSSEIYRGLQKLNVLGSVLYVAAHPDDENTRLLTYYSKEKLYKTSYLSITRGDGGQNLIGDEQGIELGLIRTQELLSARSIDGAEQYFTRAYDFGYSKNPEETLAKWNKEKILADVVWIIRKLQPDVIITRFPTTGEGGHGHHTASAILANEAFDAAADATRFSEQLQYVNPWQAKRVLWNSSNFGGANTSREDQFRIDVGAFNPFLGKGYGEIASASRSRHQSQGFGVAANRGEAFEYFKTTKGTAPVNDLFDDVTTTWNRVKGAEVISNMINTLIKNYDFTQPQKSVEGLVDVYKKIKDLPAGFWKDQKLNEVQQLIEQASGLFLEVFTTVPYVAQTDSVKFTFFLNKRLDNNIGIKNVSLETFDTSLHHALSKNKNLIFNKTLFVPSSKSISQPYWLQQPMSEGHFNVEDQQLIGKADAQPAFIASFKLNIYGEDFLFQKPVFYKYTDPVRGELYQPFVVVPPVTFNPFQQIILQQKKEETGTIQYTSHLNKTSFKSHTPPSLPAQDSSAISIRLQELQKGKSYSESFLIRNENSKTYIFHSPTDGREWGKIKRTIDYDHIPSITYFKPAVLTAKNIEVKTRGKRIGYIVGAGDKVPAALEQLGYEVVLLTEKELSRINLTDFDAIIAGVRAYNVNAWLNDHHDKMMKYVENGGNLIVQYNTSNQLGPVKAKIGPYDFSISRTRITDENAPVTFLQPQHPVLNFPNKISAEDFKGWIQERSIYHATNFDKRFETILAANDPGEKNEEGSLIIAPYGKGFFTYTGLVFFRQLPAGVPGAYRLMANLIALNHKN